MVIGSTIMLAITTTPLDLPTTNNLFLQVIKRIFIRKVKFYGSGILKKSPPRQQSSFANNSKKSDDNVKNSEEVDNYGEARNDEVIRRVAEMEKILQNAEEYLTEGEGEATDAESCMTEKSNTESELSSNYGKLKHSDSLLLLTKVTFIKS